MQEQGKRLLLAVVLGLGVILLWNFFFHKDEPAKPQGQSAASGSSGAGSGAAPLVGSSMVLPQIGPAGATGAAEAAAPATPAAPLTLAFDHFIATFSADCGGLVGWKLTDKRYERDTTKGDLLPVKARMTVIGPDGKPAPAPASELTDLPACGAFEVNFVADTSSYLIPRRAVWAEQKLSQTQVVYTYKSPSGDLEVVKDFHILPDAYFVRMDVKVTVRPPEGRDARQQLAVTSYAFQNPAELKNGSSRVAARAWSSATLRDGEIYVTDVENVIKAPRFEPSRDHGGVDVLWTGFDHPYILAGYAATNGDRIHKQTSAADGTKGRPPGLMQTDLLYDAVSFRHGDAAMTKTVVAYLGPKNWDDLQQADAAAGFPTGFNKVVDFGWFAFLGKPFLWLLQKFWEFVGNWGVSIILLTLLIKLVTLYWTTKSMRSMKAMASLAPQLKALQTKYADDKQRQQTETMALYKEHGVSPVAGCLPMLLQMPIWIALYRMLANAGELYQQPFIPGWIDDLTATDPFYILPALLFVTMFLQARLQPATGDSTQQKFLQYGMPIMFGVTSFFFPAGLTLYMFTNNVLSSLHSIYMNKFDRHVRASAEQLKKNQELVAAAAAGGKVPAGGKPGAAPGGGARKPAAPVPAAKRVIDAKATEVVADVAANAAADDGPDDGPDEPAGAPGAGAARNRPRRKKRRR